MTNAAGESAERTPADGTEVPAASTPSTPSSSTGSGDASPAGPPESAPAAASPAATPAEGTPAAGAEATPRATGVRWGDTAGPTSAPSAPTPAPTPDADATPPSGLAAPTPGTVVPDRTTGAHPVPAPGAPWPGGPGGPGGPAGPWQQQTAPGWAPPPSPSSPPDPARRRRVRRIVLGVVLGMTVLALVVVALLAFVVGPRFARYDVLDRAAVERGVTEVVTRDWKRQVTGVSCPDDARVRPGSTFTCTGTVDGRPARIPVDVLDESGTYEVGQPR